MQEKTPRIRATADKDARIEKANHFVLAANEFLPLVFSLEDKISYFYADPSGRVWYYDARNRHHVYTHHTGPWSGFADCFELQDSLTLLRDYIQSRIATGAELQARLIGMNRREPCPYQCQSWNLETDQLAELIVKATSIFRDTPPRQHKPIPKLTTTTCAECGKPRRDRDFNLEHLLCNACWSKTPDGVAYRVAANRAYRARKRAKAAAERLKPKTIPCGRCEHRAKGNESGHYCTLDIPEFNTEDAIGCSAFAVITT